MSIICIESLLFALRYLDAFVSVLSGGKDSCFNLMHCVAEGHTVVALANLRPANKGKVLPYHLSWLCWFCNVSFVIEIMNHYLPCTNISIDISVYLYVHIYISVCMQFCNISKSFVVIKNV